MNKVVKGSESRERIKKMIYNPRTKTKQKGYKIK
jgi:hypothetical protein